jgi:hypothetical protein
MPVVLETTALDGTVSTIAAEVPCARDGAEHARAWETARVQRILPGVLHWTSIHPRHGIEISSYLLEAERVLIDPMIPAEGLDWFEADGPPAAVLLTNRHHYRDSGAIAERYGTPVLVNRLGAHEFTHGEPVTFFAPGDTLPGGVRALEVGGICADETALYAPAHRAIAVADGLVRIPSDAPLGFVPDSLMHDPERTRARLLDAYQGLLDLDFDHLLLAHGHPIAGGAKEALRRFVAERASSVDPEA